MCNYLSFLSEQFSHVDRHTSDVLDAGHVGEVADDALVVLPPRAGRAQRVGRGLARAQEVGAAGAGAAVVAHQSGDRLRNHSKFTI